MGPTGAKISKRYSSNKSIPNFSNFSWIFVFNITVQPVIAWLPYPSCFLHVGLQSLHAFASLSSLTRHFISYFLILTCTHLPYTLCIG